LTLPKIDSIEEAEFYADVLDFCEKQLDIKGGIKVSVVVETL